MSALPATIIRPLAFPSRCAAVVSLATGRVVAFLPVASATAQDAPVASTSALPPAGALPVAETRCAAPLPWRSAASPTVAGSPARRPVSATGNAPRRVVTVSHCVVVTPSHFAA